MTSFLAMISIMRTPSSNISLEWRWAFISASFLLLLLNNTLSKLNCCLDIRLSYWSYALSCNDRCFFESRNLSCSLLWSTSERSPVKSSCSGIFKTDVHRMASQKHNLHQHKSMLITALTDKQVCYRCWWQLCKALTVEFYSAVMLLTFILIIISIPSIFHSRLKTYIFYNPSHRSLPFLLQDWLHGFPGLFTDTSQQIRFLLFSFLFSTF